MLKASIAVVHQLKSQIPSFIPVNQPSQGLKCLTQPGDDALFWKGRKGGRGVVPSHETLTLNLLQGEVLKEYSRVFPWEYDVFPLNFTRGVTVGVPQPQRGNIVIATSYRT